MILPRLALSVRQPWAFALAMGWKDVENRSWRVMTPPRKHRGPFCIHASKGMTRAEYEDARDFMAALGFDCPPAAELQRGGIVGVARLVDVVKEHDSAWFMGARGLVVADARPVEFVPAAGRLDFFEWHASGGEPEPPARWMVGGRPSPIPPLLLRADDRQGGLL